MSKNEYKRIDRLSHKITKDLFWMKGKFLMRPYEKGCSEILIFTRSDEVKDKLISMNL